MQKRMICENGHVFGEEAEFETCPFDGTKVSFKYDNKKYEALLQKSVRKQTATHRGLKCDTLPRVPWFCHIQNDENQDRSGEIWSLSEIEKLSDLFAENGLADEKIWTEIAEQIFHRSIYSLEHHLRMVIALPKYELKNWYK